MSGVRSATSGVCTGCGEMCREICPNCHQCDECSCCLRKQAKIDVLEQELDQLREEALAHG